MNSPLSRRCVVIGVGHRDRADDGIGPAVADALGHRTDQVVTLAREGDLAVLPLLWEADDDVVIIDAVQSSGPVGELCEIRQEDFVSNIGMSTHGLGVADALELARRLDCMPARLRIFGITGSNFGYGSMSRELHHSVDRVADELLGVLGLLPVPGTELPDRPAG